MEYLVVSALGSDEPGLVKRVTSTIAKLGGNIELQRSAQMAGEFAVMLLCRVPGDADAAIEALLALREEDLTVNARRTTPEAATHAQDNTHATLEASGADQPGIIDALSGLLYARDINIEAMDYDLEPAPMSGQPLFRMEARVEIPAGTDMKALRDAMRELEADWNFDVMMRHPVE